MKKTIFVFFSVVSLLAVIFFIYRSNYYTKYHLNPNEKEVKAYLEEYNKTKIEIISLQQIDKSNSWIAFLQLNNEKPSYAQFQEGWNNKLEFIRLKTHPNVTYDEFNTNKGKYGVLFVNELDKNIAAIKLQSQFKDFEIEIDTTASQTFMKAIKLPDNIENTAPAMFYFYDKNGELYDY